MKTNRDLQLFDILRAFACIAVFIEHFFASFDMQFLLRFREFTGSTMFSFLNNGRLAIIIFCILGGFFISRQMNRNGDANLLMKAFSRFLHLLLPSVMILFLSFLFLKYELLFNSEAYKVGNLDEYLLNILNCSATSETFLLSVIGLMWGGNVALAPQLWTIFIECISGTLCYSLFFIKKRSIRSFGALTIMAVLVMYNSSISPYIFSYFVGFLVGELCFGYKYTIRIEKNYCILAYLFLLNLASFLYTHVSAFLSVAAVGISVYMLFLLNNEYKVKNPVNKLLVFIGKNSYGIYLVHFLLIVSPFSLLYVFLHNKLNWLLEMCFFVFCLVSSVVIGFVYNRYVIIPITKGINNIIYRRIRKGHNV